MVTHYHFISMHYAYTCACTLFMANGNQYTTSQYENFITLICGSIKSSSFCQYFVSAQERSKTEYTKRPVQNKGTTTTPSGQDVMQRCSMRMVIQEQDSTRTMTILFKMLMQSWQPLKRRLKWWKKGCDNVIGILSFTGRPTHFVLWMWSVTNNRLPINCTRVRIHQ